ncbi:MAG: hypothetical protein Q9178_006765 [Gyalolechia marmorata]
MQHPLQSTKSTHAGSSLPDVSFSATPNHLENDTDKQAQLDRRRESQYRQWPKSNYKDVSVLLLRWAADNLGVIDEVKKLRDLLRSRFNFSAEIWDIPSEDPEDELTREILRFRRGKQSDSLILLYYAGHGGGDTENFSWSANHTPDSPSLNWYNVQGHLLGHGCDTLFILDCCYASLGASIHNTGNNWFLGASAKESEATGVSWKSFTSAMTRSLERAANKYWDDREKYNLHSLSYDLNLWERDLPVTPNCIRLSSHHCEPTDLTPLIYARARPMVASARTEPSLSDQPRKGYTRLPSGTMAPTTIQHNKHGGSQNNVAPFEISMTEDCQTVRISGLRWDAMAEEVTDMLRDAQIPEFASIRIGPVVQDLSIELSDTIATFPSIAVAKQALQIYGKGTPNQSTRLGRQVNMDITFKGLTTIYVPAKVLGREPNIDVVLVHGAFGHPINSFASHYSSSQRDSTTVEICWPRDELPGMLEIGGVFPRIMTHGWDADAWLSPHADVSSAADEFCTQLRNARLASPTRPLVFIGHGLGGILIKEAVSSNIYSDIEEGHFETPVKLCCFLATPHRGAARDEDFASVLTAMKRLQNPKSRVSPETHIQSLEARNRALVDICAGFDAHRQEYGISLLSAKESVRTQVQYIVPETCAIFSETPKDQISFGCNYLDLAKLPKTSVNRDNGLHHLSDRIIDQVNASKHLMPEDNRLAKERERFYERLRKYDTVFLIDDSGSMYGRRWFTASKVLADIAAIAVKYDRDGVDVKFFNWRLKDNEGKNITSSGKVVELFSKIEPRGPTFTAYRLEDELSRYIYQYNLNRGKKGLNLIILTDGEPEKGQDVEQVIVKYANRLREASAPLYQVGIQFVQIGADKAAKEFLRRLDSKIKGRHNLDRDMVDTVHWVPGDEDRLFEKILLGGVCKQLDDEDEPDGGE